MIAAPSRTVTLNWIAERFTGARSLLRGRIVLAFRDAMGTSYEAMSQLEFGKVMLATGVLL